MKFKLNGKQQEIADKDGFSIASLVQEKGLNGKNIVVEYNFKIIEKSDWGKIIINQSDNIEIVSFVGGG